MSEIINNSWVEEDDEIYHSNDGISSTQIKLICETPRHFQKCVTSISPENARIGKLIHSAVLEPDKLFSKIVIPPSGNRTLKEVKAKWVEYWKKLDRKGFLKLPLEDVLKLKVSEYHLAYSEKCIPAQAEELTMCRRIHETLQEYPAYQDKLEGIKEMSGYQSVIWDLREVLCKCRPDVRNKERGYLLDIKTVSDIKQFTKQFFNLGYHISGAYYMDIANIIDDNVYNIFYWLVIQKSEPYPIMMFQEFVAGPALTLGRTSYEEGLTRYVNCMNSGHWPLYPERIDAIPVPKYLVKEVE